MPLQLPNLDDRNYNDLVAEALARIPAYSPEWTNYNSSDPGITLVELFAWLTDLLLYRLNRVTDNNVRKFLKLLNDPDWATGDLHDEIRKTVLAIRERYRAVTKEDYEFLATESFNQWLVQTVQSSDDAAQTKSLAAINLVARAHCVPQQNLDAGTEADRMQLKPEHVSVVILPAPQRPNLSPPPSVVQTNDTSPSPQPSEALNNAVLSYLDERCMLTTKLHVTGPFYAHVSAQLVIARNSDAVDTDVIDQVNAALTSLFNPLPSENSQGWPFGQDVFASAIYGALDQIPTIDFSTDVMLSSSCTADDNKCVIAAPIWHAEGDFVGLNIEEHHLPVFDHADIVVASHLVFVTVDLTVSAKAAANADLASLKRLIKSTIRDIFHPGLGGPGPATDQPTNIFASDITVAIKQIPGVLDPVEIGVECTPSGIRQTDPDRGVFVHVDAGNVVDWRVKLQLSEQ